MKRRKSNGYYLVYSPDSKTAQKSGTHKGWDYEHRVVMQEYLGYDIPEGYEVHHLDSDRTNNHIDNLIMLSKQDHLKLHRFMDNGAVPEIQCKHCGKKFRSRRDTYCSVECGKLAQRRCERPSKDELEKLIWEMPFTKIGEQYGVSDNSVRKWCKGYNITNRPPRGYFLRGKSLT